MVDARHGPDTRTPPLERSLAGGPAASGPGGRGFEQLEILRDDRAGVFACIAIDSTALGPAFGGIRRFPYRSAAEAVADALDLAAAMTAKCVLAGVPAGGAKTVVWQREGTDRRRAYELVGEHVEALGGRYYTGPDIGTTPDDLRVVGTRTRFVARPDEEGAPAGGPGDLATPTALGVYAGIRAVVRRAFDGRALGPDVHVVVQGLGAVGARLVDLLAADGCRLTVADVREDAAREVAARTGAAAVAPDAVLDVAADVFAPCALGGVLDAAAVETLRVRAVAGSANNVLAGSGVGDLLHQRGILFAPDPVITSGALLHGALTHLEGAPPPRERILEIGDRVEELLALARERDVPPERIAEERVAQVLRDAGSRRWFPRPGG